MAPQRSFDRFPRLPKELRIMIWKFATQAQRTISIRRLHTSFLDHHHHHSNHNLPAVLQAYRLSRLIGQENYRVLGTGHKLQYLVYFAPASDVVYCASSSSYTAFARETKACLGSTSGIRFVIFKAEDLDSMGVLRKIIDVPFLERGIIPLYAHSEGIRGIYHCTQCSCKVSQIYGLEFKWELIVVKGGADEQNKEGIEAKEKLHIRVLGRWDIDREFGDGPWNRDRCIACPSQQGLTWTENPVSK